jgi:EmrB/QacA subfamily drug resistance transporter
MSTEHHQHSAQHHASKFTARQKTIALVIVALAFIMDLLDNTIVNIAIPSIQNNLGASYAAIQWLAAGYALTFAVLLITGGRMGDVFGYKKLFLTGVAGFTAASLLSGAAWNIEVLVGARLLQGAMAALMVPQVMSLMQIMYKPEERGKVMGLFGAMAGLAASLGPVVGGLLIQANIFSLDWRPIFLINIPVGIFAFFAAIKYLPEGKSTHPLKLDLPGTGLIVLALSLLIFPLIEGRDLDWPIWTFLMMTASLPFFGIFIWWQHKKTAIDNSPLILPSLFKHYNTFTLGLVVNIIFEMIMLGFFFTFTLLLQVGLGYSVLEAALTGIPTAIGISVSIGFLAQKLIPKLGRYAMTVGTLILAAGFITTALMLQIIGTDATPWHFVPGLLIIGTGMGLVMGPIFSVTLSKVDPAHAGSGSGTLSAIQQLGGAIGIAAIGVLFFGQLGIHAGNSFDKEAAPAIANELSKAHIPEAMQSTIAEGTRTCFVDRTKQKDGSATPESCKKIEASQSKNPAGKAIGIAITDAVKKANSHNFLYGFGIATVYVLGLIVAIFGLSFLLPKKFQMQQGH